MQKPASAVQNKVVMFLERFFTGNGMDYKSVFAIILPLFVDSLFIVLMSIMNTAMVSSSGVAAVSAVSIVDTLNIFTVSLFIAVATGGTVIVAQYKGRGDTEMVSKAASQAISSVTALAIVLSVLVIIFHNPVLNMLFGSAEKEVMDNARLFLIGSSISYPFAAIYQAATGALRGVGETKACLVLSVILNLSYFVLNVILIKGFDMGVLGLSISLIAARVLGMAASLIYLMKYNQTLRFKLKNALHVNLSIIKKIMYIGIPFAMEQIFFNGGKLLTQTYIVQFGTLALTINAIGNSLAMLYQVGANTLSTAIVTIVGQSIGRKDIADARKFIKSIIGLTSVSFVFMSFIILPFFPLIVKMYSPPAEIVPTIFMLMVMIAIAQPLVYAFSFTMPAALRAAGDSKFTSVASLISMWVFRVILGYVFGVTLGYGIVGVWAAMVVEWGIRGAIFTWRYRGDKWYAHKII